MVLHQKIKNSFKQDLKTNFLKKATSSQFDSVSSNKVLNQDFIIILRTLLLETNNRSVLLNQNLGLLGLGLTVLLKQNRSPRSPRSPSPSDVQTNVVNLTPKLSGQNFTQSVRPSKNSLHKNKGVFTTTKKLEVCASFAGESQLGFKDNKNLQSLHFVQTVIQKSLLSSNPPILNVLKFTNNFFSQSEKACDAQSLNTNLLSAFLPNLKSSSLKAESLKPLPLYNYLNFYYFSTQNTTKPSFSKDFKTLLAQSSRSLRSPSKFLYYWMIPFFGFYTLLAGRSQLTGSAASLIDFNSLAQTQGADTGGLLTNFKTQTSSFFTPSLLDLQNELHGTRNTGSTNSTYGFALAKPQDLLPLEKIWFSTQSFESKQGGFELITKSVSPNGLSGNKAGGLTDFKAKNQHNVALVVTQAKKAKLANQELEKLTVNYLANQSSQLLSIGFAKAKPSQKTQISLDTSKLTLLQNNKLNKSLFLAYWNQLNAVDFGVPNMAPHFGFDPSQSKSISSALNNSLVLPSSSNQNLTYGFALAKPNNYSLKTNDFTLTQPRMALNLTKFVNQNVNFVFAKAKPLVKIQTSSSVNGFKDWILTPFNSNQGLKSLPIDLLNSYTEAFKTGSSNWVKNQRFCFSKTDDLNTNKKAASLSKNKLQLSKALTTNNNIKFTSVLLKQNLELALLERSPIAQSASKSGFCRTLNLDLSFQSFEKPWQSLHSNQIQPLTSYGFAKAKPTVTANKSNFVLVSSNSQLPSFQTELLNPNTTSLVEIPSLTPITNSKKIATFLDNLTILYNWDLAKKMPNTVYTLNVKQSGGFKSDTFLSNNYYLQSKSKNRSIFNLVKSKIQPAPQIASVSPELLATRINTLKTQGFLTTEQASTNMVFKHSLNNGVALAKPNYNRAFNTNLDSIYSFLSLDKSLTNGFAKAKPIAYINPIPNSSNPIELENNWLQSLARVAQNSLTSTQKVNSNELQHSGRVCFSKTVNTPFVDQAKPPGLSCIKLQTPILTVTRLDKTNKGQVSLQNNQKVMNATRATNTSFSYTKKNKVLMDSALQNNVVTALLKQNQNIAAPQQLFTNYTITGVVDQLKPVGVAEASATQKGLGTNLNLQVQPTGVNIIGSALKSSSRFCFRDLKTEVKTELDITQSETNKIQTVTTNPRNMQNRLLITPNSFTNYLGYIQYKLKHFILCSNLNPVIAGARSKEKSNMRSNFSQQTATAILENYVPTIENSHNIGLTVLRKQNRALGQSPKSASKQLTSKPPVKSHFNNINSFAKAKPIESNDWKYLKPLNFTKNLPIVLQHKKLFVLPKKQAQGQGLTLTVLLKQNRHPLNVNQRLNQIQKKRKAKKQRLESRRQKKRKRFYPRPNWLRLRLTTQHKLTQFSNPSQLQTSLALQTPKAMAFHLVKSKKITNLKKLKPLLVNLASQNTNSYGLGFALAKPLKKDLNQYQLKVGLTDLKLALNPGSSKEFWSNKRLKATVPATFMQNKLQQDILFENLLLHSKKLKNLKTDLSRNAANGVRKTGDETSNFNIGFAKAKPTLLSNSTGVKQNFKSNYKAGLNTNRYTEYLNTNKLFIGKKLLMELKNSNAKNYVSFENKSNNNPPNPNKINNNSFRDFWVWLYDLTSTNNWNKELILNPIIPNLPISIQNAKFKTLSQVPLQDSVLLKQNRKMGSLTTQQNLAESTGDTLQNQPLNLGLQTKVANLPSNSNVVYGFDLLNKTASKRFTNQLKTNGFALAKTNSNLKSINWALNKTNLWSKTGSNQRYNFWSAQKLRNQSKNNKTKFIEKQIKNKINSSFSNLYLKSFLTQSNNNVYKFKISQKLHKKEQKLSYLESNYLQTNTNFSRFGFNKTVSPELFFGSKKSVQYQIAKPTSNLAWWSGVDTSWLNSTHKDAFILPSYGFALAKPTLQHNINPFGFSKTVKTSFSNAYSLSKDTSVLLTQNRKQNKSFRENDLFNYTLFFAIATHFCALITLLSISQIRCFIKFHLILVHKLSNAYLQIIYKNLDIYGFALAKPTSSIIGFANAKPMVGFKPKNTLLKPEALNFKTQFVNPANSFKALEFRLTDLLTYGFTVSKPYNFNGLEYFNKSKSASKSLNQANVNTNFGRTFSLVKNKSLKSILSFALKQKAQPTSGGLQDLVANKAYKSVLLKQNLPSKQNRTNRFVIRTPNRGKMGSISTGGLLFGKNSDLNAKSSVDKPDLPPTSQFINTKRFVFETLYTLKQAVLLKQNRNPSLNQKPAESVKFTSNYSSSYGFAKAKPNLFVKTRTLISFFAKLFVYSKMKTNVFAKAKPNLTSNNDQQKALNAAALNAKSLNVKTLSSQILLTEGTAKMLKSVNKTTLNTSYKIVDTFESLLRLIYSFFEKPAELTMDWIAYAFLVEWSSDLLTFTPEKTEKQTWLAFSKWARQSKIGLSLTTNTSNPIHSSLFTNNFSLILWNITLGQLFYKRILYLNDLFLEVLNRPDTDLINRQKKGTLFWDIWSDVLIKAADKYNINVPSLSNIKEEQNLLIDKFLGDNLSLKPNVKSAKTLGALHPTDLKSVLLKQNRLGLAKSKNGLQDLFEINAINSSFSNSKVFKKGLWLFTNVKTPGLNQVLNSRFCYSKTDNELNISNFELLKKSTQDINQFVTYQSKETDLFLDYHPPKSFAGDIGAIRYYNLVQQPLGTLVCQIYSGLLTKQIAKNILVIGSTLSSNTNTALERTQKTLLIQALAGETEIKIITDNASRYAVVNRGFAVGIKLLKDVFEAITLNTPCLFLLEDIHLIGERRPLLISDSGSDNGTGDELSKATENTFGAQRNGDAVHEKNQILYQLNRHSITHYKKPFKGDFSLSIPTNHFAFDLFLKSRNTNYNATPTHPFAYSLGSLDLEHITASQGNSSQTSELNLANTLQKLTSKRSSSSTNFETTNTGQILASSLQFGLNSLNKLLSPPSTSPFTVLLLKEQKKLKPKRIVKELPWVGLSSSEQQLGLLPAARVSYSVRAKVAALADLGFTNMSAKLDMITDLLVIIDSVRGNRGFVVFATTHLPHILDPALRRPGRLDETISIPTLSNIWTRWEFTKTTHPIFTSATQFPNLTQLVTNYTFSHKNLVGYYGILNKLDFINLDFVSNHASGALISSIVSGYKQANLTLQSKSVLLKQNRKSGNGLIISPLSGCSKHKLTSYYPFCESKTEVKKAKQFKQMAQIAYHQLGKKLITNTYSFSLASLTTIYNNPTTYESTVSLTETNQYLQNQSQYSSLYSSPEFIKNTLVSLLSGKLTQEFSVSNFTTLNKAKAPANTALRPYDFALAKPLIQNQKLAKTIGFAKAKPINPFGTAQHIASNVLSLYGIDQTWRAATSLALSFVQKRYLYNKNLIIPKLLNFTNFAQLGEPPSPPTSNILIPTKRYENAKKALKQNIEQKVTESIQDKLEAHTKQSYIKSIYQKTSNGGFNNSLSVSLKQNRQFKINSLASLENPKSPLTQVSSSYWFYDKKILKRHRNYLNNQWWNGQLTEHSSETLFLSDIDWRYTFIDNLNSPTLTQNKKIFFNKLRVLNSINGFAKAKQSGNTEVTAEFEKISVLLKQNRKTLNSPQSQDIVIDFPDADQHYNPNNRRWMLTTGAWDCWFTIDKKLQTEIFDHLLTECIVKSFTLLDNNRELLDYTVSKYMTKGIIKNQNLIFALKKFRTTF
jgi:hypothetical protein